MISDLLDRFLTRIGISGRHAQLIVLTFAVSLIAKGGVLYHGFSVDDFAVSLDQVAATYPTFLSQGRFLDAAIIGAMDAMGVSVGDVYIAFGLLALFLHSALIVSILRFVGVDEDPGAGVVAALMAIHPYGAEIFTFRMALPIFSAALLFSIVILEAIVRYPSQLPARIWAFLAALAMLFTYQVLANYFAVAILFVWIHGEISAKDRRSTYRERGILLAAVTIIAMAVFISVMRILSLLGVVSAEPRTRLITLDMVPQRLVEVVESLKRIYWEAEPIMPALLKILIWVLIGLCVIRVIRCHLGSSQNEKRIQSSVRLILAMVLLVPLSLGLIVFFQAWWPVPRVVSHVGVIIGLVFLLGDACGGSSWNPLLRRVQELGRGVILIAFVLMCNQIFADQSKLNDWDMMTATRLVGRLEDASGFKNIRYAHISGGWWGYPAGLRTVTGNMNTSALGTAWSKVALLVVASGYRFQPADGKQQLVGERYCDTAPTWPEIGSTTVDGDLAIICLQK